MAGNLHRRGAVKLILYQESGTDQSKMSNRFMPQLPTEFHENQSTTFCSGVSRILIEGGARPLMVIFVVLYLQGFCRGVALPLYHEEENRIGCILRPMFSYLLLIIYLYIKNAAQIC